MLSGRGVCDGPINRPEESYSLCVCVCVWVWSGATITLYTYNELVDEIRLRRKESKKFDFDVYFVFEGEFIADLFIICKIFLEKYV
jgi:hypothetical protein